MASPKEDPIPDDSSPHAREKGVITNDKLPPNKPPSDEESDHPIAPDQTDPSLETSLAERWSYYAYYIGNNGLSLFNFAPTAAQNLLAQHATDLGGPDNDLIPFAGVDRTVTSIILLCNGWSFAIQAVLFLTIGAYADFGTFRPNILILFSLIAWGIGFGWLGVHSPSEWEAGLGLYIVGLIAYQTCLTYWTAAFPGLARNTREMREKAREYEAGEIELEEYHHEDMMRRNELSNVAFYVQSVAELFILAVLVGVLFGVRVNDSQANTNYGLSIVVAYTTGVWLLVAIPWFWLEKRRPGPDPGMNIFMAGLYQLWRAISQIWQLRQSLCYLIGYFLLGDSLNTTVTVVSILQNNLVEYDPLQLTYLLIVGIAAQAVGIGVYWKIQKRFGLSSKTMFNTVAIAIVILDLWGMIGIWTDKFGFHNVWELWLYQGFYGLFVCPWYSYSQVMISEVTPRGKEFLFFSLFSLIGKTSSFIGPFISQAIIDSATARSPDAASDPRTSSTPFYFLFALSLVTSVFLWWSVDLGKSRVEQEVFLERERVAKAKIVEKGVVGIDVGRRGSVDGA